LPTSNSIDAPRAPCRATRHGSRVRLEFAAARALAPALGLLAFAAVCALLPALGLSAMLPLDRANAAAIASLTLIGGFAAPFILASVVFAAIAVYQLSNTLCVDIEPDGIHTERRVLGYLTQRRHIARADIADIEPSISARFQNAFGKTPRYALIARHRHIRAGDVVIAEDVLGAANMQATRDWLRQTLDLK